MSTKEAGNIGGAIYLTTGYLYMLGRAAILDVVNITKEDTRSIWEIAGQRRFLKGQSIGSCTYEGICCSSKQLYETKRVS